MSDDKKKSARYAIAMPIETSRGPAVTERVGPKAVRFLTGAQFVAGEEITFGMSLRGTANGPVDVECVGTVLNTRAAGESFVVEASIDRMQIRSTAEEKAGGLGVCHSRPCRTTDPWNARRKS
jgi:hypothetical protein